MEQLKTTRNLSDREKKNVYLAVACGSLASIHENIPGPSHQRKKRVLRKVHEEIYMDIAPRLPRVEKHNMALFIDTVKASRKVMDEIVKSGRQEVHVLLNLAAFCLRELPLRKKHWDLFNPLFEMWENASEYQDKRSGERIFLRIESEMAILVAQRGGIIL